MQKQFEHKPDHFMTTGNGKLRLYNAFPRHYATMAEATADLGRIGKLGFNAVWINPIQSTSSSFTVTRTNEVTLRKEQVRGSLYACFDFSQLNHRLFPDLKDEQEKPAVAEGDPGYSSLQEQRKLQTYTSTAKTKGLQPIFDLVLNHVALDSPLTTGDSPYFKNKGIDTTRWFLKKDEKWDDTLIFDYSEPEIRDEIIRELWMPYIHKYINDFGFEGVRVDFAGGRVEEREVEKVLFEEIKRLVAAKGTEAIIFAELLPPAKKLDENATALRELYTHVTNSTLWGVEDTKHERGVKQQVTHLMHDGTPREFAGGTVGFAGSHDNNPNARNALKSLALKSIEADEQRKKQFYSPEHKQAEDLALAVTEQINLSLRYPQNMKTSLFNQRQRLALSALSSDGGWYLLSGDEFGKVTPVSIFENTDGEPVYDDVKQFQIARAYRDRAHTGLIQNLNQAIADMPRAAFVHWSTVITLDGDYKDLVVVMNYNAVGFTDPKPFLSVVNVTGQPVTITDDIVKKIAEVSQQRHNHDPLAYEAVLKAQKQLIGPFETHLSCYEFSRYYTPESEPLILNEGMNRNASDEVLVWETDIQGIQPKSPPVSPGVSKAGLFQMALLKARLQEVKKPKLEDVFNEAVLDHATEIREGNLDPLLIQLQTHEKSSGQAERAMKGLKELIEKIAANDDETIEQMHQILGRQMLLRM